MTVCVTSALPPITGTVRQTPEDFYVDEVPAYPAAGQGTHVYFRIEKRDLTTFEAVRQLAYALDRPQDDFGYAGLKDKRAVARQWLSLEHVAEAAVRALRIPGVTVLEVTRHGNKLRTGHLRGNHFRLRVRGSADAAGDQLRADALLALLVRRGVPNAYGRQRFGRDGRSALVGRALLAGQADEALALLVEGQESLAAELRDPVAQALRQGELARAAEQIGDHPGPAAGAVRAAAGRRSAQQGLRVLPRRLLTLLVSAVQSEIFNRVLEARRDSYDQVLAGDLAFLHRNGACFLVEDVAREAPRAAAFEISPSGPILGPRTLMGGGEPRAIEDAVIAASGLTGADFDRIAGIRQKGARRSLRVPLADAQATLDAEGLVLQFFLPAGAYATVVLEQLFQTPVDLVTVVED
jgi:tRNA pseudouridine13 synthase